MIFRMGFGGRDVGEGLKLRHNCCLVISKRHRAPKAYVWVSSLLPDTLPTQQQRFPTWPVPAAVGPGTFHPVLDPTGFTSLPACEIIQTANHFLPLEPGATAPSWYYKPVPYKPCLFIPSLSVTALWPHMADVVLPWAGGYLWLRNCYPFHLSGQVSCVWSSLTI